MFVLEGNTVMRYFNVKTVVYDGDLANHLRNV